MPLTELRLGIFSSPFPYSGKPPGELTEDNRWVNTRLGSMEQEIFANWLIALSRHYAQWVGVALEEIDAILNGFKHTTNSQMRFIQRIIPRVAQKMQQARLVSFVEQGGYTIILPNQKLLDHAH